MSCACTHRLPGVDVSDIIRSEDVDACTVSGYCLCMRRQSTITIDTAALDRRAVALGLTRNTGDGKTVVSSSAIARRLNVAQSTVSRARAGKPVGGAFVMAASTRLGIPLDVLVRQAVAA